MTYHFALPAAAVLSGEGHIRMDPGSVARVRVDGVDEAGDRLRILDQRVEADEPRAVRLRADLSADSSRADSSQMVQLDFSFRLADGSSGSADLDWR